MILKAKDIVKPLQALIVVLLTLVAMETRS
jgi:hypothetical protein